MNSRPYILFADDRLTNCFLMSDTLADEFDFFFIPTGGECIKSMEKRLPDLLMIGDSMPIQDSQETTNILKNHQQYQKVPIMFVNKDNVRLATDNIHQFSLKKPIDKEQLLWKIEQLLNCS